MTSPFDSLAPQYAQLWSEHPEGRSQRAEVWREIDELFCMGQHVLDLGCGIGDDALHLAERGVRVSAMDSSPRMAATARARGVDAVCLPIEALHELSGQYDGALSNFAAFNCVEDVELAARDLARLIRPGGAFALCVLSRICWRETVRALRRGDVGMALRRWPGRATWRGIDVYYRSRREWVRRFAPHFELIRSQSIGGGDHQLYVFVRSTV